MTRLGIILLVSALIALSWSSSARIRLSINGGGGVPINSLTPDNTACLAPGSGSFSTGPPATNGAYTVLANGCTMKTKYGTWTWGTGPLLGPGVGDGEQNANWQVILNGKITLKAFSLYVACGGNMFFMDDDQNIWLYTANTPYGHIVASPLSAFPLCSSISPLPDPLPSVPPTGFTASADGTNFTCPGAGTATSVDGVWTCGPTCTIDCQSGTSYDMHLNGIRVEGMDGVTLQIDSQGQAFSQNSGGGWRSYLVYQPVGLSGSPSTSPIPIASHNDANPAISNLQFTSCVSIPPDTRAIPCFPYTTTITPCTADPCNAATVVATPVITMSNGSPFVPVGAPSWTIANVTECPVAMGAAIDTTSLFRFPFTGTNANKLMFNRQPASGDADGLSKECEIWPVANGMTFLPKPSTYFNVSVQ